MVAEANAAVPCETGGVLMGYWSDSGTEVVIVTLIGPGPRAERATDGLMPDHAFQEAAVERVYRESGRIVTYLGDWHTHPKGIAALRTR